MNKIFTKIASLTLGLAMAIGVGVAVGIGSSKEAEPVHAAISSPDDSITFSDKGWSNQYSVNEVAIAVGDSTVTFSKGSGSTNPQYYTSGTAIRWYAKGTLTVASQTKTIEAIDITFGSSDGNNALTADVGTWDSPSWTGSASSVTFTQGGTSGNRRIAGIAIKYSSGGDPATYSGVEVSEKTPLTGTYKGEAYYECQATVTGTGPISQSVTWSITSDSTYGTGTAIANKASVDNNGKITFLDNCTVYAWATAADGATHNASGFAVTASDLIDTPVSTWTKVTSASQVSVNKVYALSNDGINFASGAVADKQIALTTAYSSIGYFVLEETTGGYYLSFATYTNDAWASSSSYINNSDKTDLTNSNTAAAVWALGERESSVYLKNTSNGNRHLGVSTDVIKAYATSNIETNVPVYLYEVGSLPVIECDTIELTGKPTGDMDIGAVATLGYSAKDADGNDWTGDVVYSISNESTTGVVELSATTGASVTLTAKKAGTARVSVQDAAGNADPDYVDVTVLADPERIELPVGSYEVKIDAADETASTLPATRDYEIKAKEGRTWYQNLTVGFTNISVLSNYDEYESAKSTGALTVTNNSNATISNVEVHYYKFLNDGVGIYVDDVMLNPTSSTGTSGTDSDLYRGYTNITGNTFALKNKNSSYTSKFYSITITLTVKDESEEFDSLTITKGETPTTFDEGDLPSNVGLTVHENYTTDGGQTISRSVDVTDLSTWEYSIETIAAGTTSYTVTASYGGHTTEAVTIDGFTVNALPKYSKVTSQDELFDGQVVILVIKGTNNKTAKAMHTSNYFTVQDANFVGDKIVSKNEMEFTVRMYGNKFALEYGEGSFLNYYGSSNYVYLTEETLNADAAKCGWSFDDTGLLSNEGRYLRYNHSSPRFACYTNDSYQVVQLYKSDASTMTTQNKADTFLYRELHLRDIATTDNTDGTACKGDNGYYNTAKAVFTSESFADAKSIVLANEDAVARLTAWAAANGDVFDSTNGTFTPAQGSARIFGNDIENGDMTATIVVIVSMATITLLGACLILRKRREQR